MSLEEAFFNLIIIKMPITGYFIHFEVFFRSCNMELIFVQFFFIFLFQSFNVATISMTSALYMAEQIASAFIHVELESGQISLWIFE